MRKARLLFAERYAQKKALALCLIKDRLKSQIGIGPLQRAVRNEEAPSPLSFIHKLLRSERERHKRHSLCSTLGGLY